MCPAQFDGFEPGLSKHATQGRAREEAKMRIPPWLCDGEVVPLRVPSSADKVEPAPPESDVRDTGNQHAPAAKDTGYL